jgi:nucleotide-binding universal stress UspA family protein
MSGDSMTILCPIDGSRHSEWALELAPQLIHPMDARLVLLHVVDAGKFRAAHKLGTQSDEAIAEALALAEQGGERLLGRTHDAVSSHWKQILTKVAKGDPAAAIVQTAARTRSRLIVMGSRGLTDFRPFLLGSVSRRVVTIASCPVLVVKRPISSLQHIIVCTDGSKPARAALEFVLSLRLPGTARITVTTVVPPLPIDTGQAPAGVASISDKVRAALTQQAHKTAAEEASRIKDEGYAVHLRVTQGPVAPDLVNLAEAERADLIVLGSRGLTGATRFLMGSVSDSVVKYAPCSVLVHRR